MPIDPATAEDSCSKNQISSHGHDEFTSPESPPARSSHSQPGAMTSGGRDEKQSSTQSEHDTIPAPALEDANLTPAASESHLSFPDGGFQAWLVVLGSFCAQGAVFGLINTAAVFESYFKTHQLKDYTNSEIGCIFSLYLFLVFFVGVQAGPVFDRHGSRHLLFGGSLCVVTSLMLLSISQTYYQIILTYSVLGGLGGAMLNAPAYGAIAHFFHLRRGLATGVATTAGGVGGIVFPLLLQFLLGDEEGVGFGWSCRILGFILLGLCTLANLLIRTRLPPLAVGPDDGDKKKRNSVWPDFSIFRDRRYALSALGIFFMEFGLFVPLTYIVSYATAHGLGTSDSFMVLSLLNAGSVFGRFLPGFLADKIGRFNVIILAISLCVATLLGLWLPAGSSKATIIAFCVLFGFASGSNLGLAPVCIGQFCAPQDYGRYFCTAQMLASFGTLASVPIGGALLERGHESTGWMGLILFSGLSYVVALGCYASARILAIGWHPLVKF
ncbi:Major facilitator superfamily domain, general substrate transporter [Metarhizium rileyi]|uniref:Major facilitator superfamily domain, general substrate transporter n=1 Tax=Metarhizium rileyi (strain RCEF 4871) TaxID=1649241 RepID=A0A167ENB6_METRR|nr:Major facilitator superfamily domain, general substrate transporter [Metarhizium rileyi RCEF 4871]